MLPLFPGKAKSTCLIEETSPTLNAWLVTGGRPLFFCARGDVAHSGGFRIP